MGLLAEESGLVRHRDTLDGPSHMLSGLMPLQLCCGSNTSCGLFSIGCRLRVRVAVMWM